MGLLQALMQFLRLKPKEEALQYRSESLQKPSEALQYRSESLQSLESLQSTPEVEEKNSIELQKDSIQLGLAAGYVGRTLKDIESSLSRIESQIVTKDWFLSQFEDRTPELVDLLKKHEENDQKRFEAIQNILISLQKTAERTPEPFKTELFQEIKAIEQQLPLTPKMAELLEIVKESKEISYDELHQKLGISISALRGLLSNMAKRTDQIERFERNNKGWVRYRGD
jgi:DNA-binding CsgD family transcriptional regulator